MKKSLKRIVLLVIFALLVQSLLLAGCSKVKESGTALVGIVTDVEKQSPIYDVKIELKSTTSNKIYNGRTDAQGRYKIFCEDGYYTIKATKAGYSNYEKNIVLSKGTNQEDFYLSKLLEKPCSLTGTVVNETNNEPIAEATVQLGSNIVKTDKSGKFRMEKLPVGEFSTWVTAPGYEALNIMVNLTRGLNATTFKLKPLGKAGSTTGSVQNEPKRNIEYAVSPTYLEDYVAHSIRIVHPDNERHEYWLTSQDRYTKYLKYDEHIEKGEYLYIGNKVYKNDGKGWKEIDPANVTFQPDTPIQIDLQGVLYLFNFEDPNIEIKEIGKEKVNGYDTRKFTIKSKPQTPKEKTIDATIWIIGSLEDPRLNRVITRIKGKTAYDTTTNTWADVEINFTNIGKGNTVKKPEGIK